MIFIPGGAPEPVAAWLADVLGGLAPIEAPQETGSASQSLFYDAAFGGAPVQVRLLSVPGEDRLEVWLLGGFGELPWASDLDFARAASLALGRAVLCDPGPPAADPDNPNAFYRVAPEGEGPVEWGERTDDDDEALRQCEASAEVAYASMYDAPSGPQAKACYEDACEHFARAIATARRAGLNDEADRLTRRLGQVRDVFNHQFRWV